ncbi:MAG: hypothetical protein WD898_00895 [Candidatus Paceibacterota bacterium]
MKRIREALALIFVPLFFSLSAYGGDCEDLHLISATTRVVKYGETILVHGCNFSGNLYVRIGNRLVVPAEKLSTEFAVAQMPYVPVIPTHIRVEVEAVVDGAMNKSNTVTLQAWPEDMPFPEFKGGWLVDGATFRNGVFSPGMIATLFGNSFTRVEEALNKMPLPRELAGLSVFYGDKAVALFYVGPSQINFMIPLEADERRVVLMRFVTIGPDGLKYVSQTSPVQTVPSVPRVFMYLDDQGKLMPVVTDSSWQIVNQDNPARAGQSLAVFLTGLGKVAPEVASGNPAPEGSRVVNWPIVRVGKYEAEVLFAGLAPGYSGLYQLNFVLPGGLAPGKVSVTISAKGESTTIVLPVN